MVGASRTPAPIQDVYGRGQLDPRVQSKVRMDGTCGPLRAQMRRGGTTRPRPRYPKDSRTLLGSEAPRLRRLLAAVRAQRAEFWIQRV